MPETSSLVSGNRLGEDFPGENHSPARTVKHVLEYTFLSSKNNKQETKKRTVIKKAKETNEKKRIFPENRLKKLT